MPATQPPWWRGARGEWYVVAQLVLIAVVFFAPRTIAGLPDWPNVVSRIALFFGFALMAVGICLLLAGLFRLGPNLTPLPFPKPTATLVETGPYRFVRHPMYSGGIMLAYGWALYVHGWLTLIYATVLLIFLNLKSAREEQWLVAKFPEYPSYQRRVRKLIPFIY